MRLKSGRVTLDLLRRVNAGPTQVELDPADWRAIEASSAVLDKLARSKQSTYGVNTGFGKLANTRIPGSQLEQLQKNLLLSHACGTGELLDDDVVRLILTLKVLGLARGYSGVKPHTVEMLLHLINHQVYPCIPSKGSVGASGDLAPLAHMSLPLMGLGQVRHRGKIMDAQEGLRAAELEPVVLGPKEGLALVNGTQVSTALALHNLFAMETVFAAAVLAGSLSVDAMKGSDKPFDPRIQSLRGQRGQIEVAEIYRSLLDSSEIRASHIDCEKVQDPYSLRCQPQVMGAVLDSMRHAGAVLEIEANAVTDNPLIFPDSTEAISGGNFHAESVAIAADLLAIAVSEIGAISERRVANLVDPDLSGLPAFLVDNPGLNSGFMIAQVTAAALASENKSLAHPASVDSLPTSANQEDHVSMATFAARRLGDMVENVLGIVAIELLAATQAIEFHRPSRTSDVLEAAIDLLRTRVPRYEEDRFFAPDIETTKGMVRDGALIDPVMRMLLKAS